MIVRRATSTAAALALCASALGPATLPALAQTTPVTPPAAAPAPAVPPPATPSPAPAPVASEPVTAEGAQALAAALKQGMQRWLGSFASGPAVQWQGDPLVMPAGTHYAVALPVVTIVDGDERIEVPSIRMEVVPLPERTYGVSMVLPSALTVQEKGDPVATVSLGKQQIKGVWAAAYDNFLSFDATLGDLKVSSGDGTGELTVASLSALQDLRRDEGTLYSGPAVFALSGLEVTDAEGEAIVEVRGLTLESTYTRFDLAKLAALTAMAEQAATAGRDPAAAQVADSLLGLLGGASLRLRAAGISVYDEDSDATVSLEQFSVRGGAENLDREKASASFGFEARGLGIDPAPGPEQFIPQTFNIQISLVDVPSAALIRLFGEPVGVGQIKPGDPAEEALAILTTAGAALRIDALEVGTPLLSALLTGSARFAPDAALGGVADVTASVRGIDQAAKALQPKPGKPADPDMQDVLGGLAMLQAMGQQGKDAEGRDIRRYDLSVTPQGQILLNGADMGPMLGMGGR